MQKSVLRHMCEAGVIAALYAVLTLLIPALSFGPLQVRLSELLTILPVFTPAAIPGLAIGCFFSNLFGIVSGANLAGAWDLLFGTTATVSAAVFARCCRNIRLFKLPILSALFATVINGFVVGAELTIAVFNSQWALLPLCIAEVAVGELMAATIGGLLLCFVLEKTGASKSIFRGGISS